MGITFRLWDLVNFGDPIHLAVVGRGICSLQMVFGRLDSKRVLRGTQSGEMDRIETCTYKRYFCFAVYVPNVFSRLSLSRVMMIASNCSRDSVSPSSVSAATSCASSSCSAASQALSVPTISLICGKT